MLIDPEFLNYDEISESINDPEFLRSRIREALGLIKQEPEQ